MLIHLLLKVHRLLKIHGLLEVQGLLQVHRLLLIHLLQAVHLLLLLGKLLLLVHHLLMIELIPDIHRMRISPVVVHFVEKTSKTKWTKSQLEVRVGPIRVWFGWITGISRIELVASTWPRHHRPARPD